MTEKGDIFDRIMLLPFFRIFRPFYLKFKEQLLYLFFGGLTTLISILVFALFTSVIPMDALVANIISWILAVLFAYVTNRTWVFEGAEKDNFWKQMVVFYGGRLATLLVEELILLVFVKILMFHAMTIKIIAQIIIIILNYIISKLFVFKESSKN